MVDGVIGVSGPAMGAIQRGPGDVLAHYQAMEGGPALVKRLKRHLAQEVAQVKLIFTKVCIF